MTALQESGPIRHPSRWRALKLLLETGWRASRWRSLVSAATSIGLSLSHITAIYGMKVIVDGATASSLPRAAVGAGLIAVAMTARMGSSLADGVVSAALRERTAVALETRLVSLAAGIPGIAHHERADLLDQVQLLRDSRYELGNVVTTFFGNFSTIVQVSMTAVLLADVHPALLLVPVAGTTPLIASAMHDRVINRVNERTAEKLRLTERLLDLALDPRAAGELRLHRGDELVLRRHREAHEARLAVREPAILRYRLIVVAGGMTFAAARLAAIGFVALRAADGATSPGAALLAFGLLARVSSQVESLANGGEWLLRCLRAVARLAWLIDEADRETKAYAGFGLATAPVALADGIRFEGVTFRYHGTDEPALAGVDLHLPAGKTIALVGENGAGKTTLVKLLVRLYDPTEGRIIVDGVDLRAIPVDEWRRRMSGAFQEPAPLELEAREVVGIGDIVRIDEPGAVEAAVERAGAERVVAQLEAGLATPVGPSFEHGAELSGGQWQQLALARAMMRVRPLLLLLDEPTAALDPGREFNLFERYAQAARDAAALNGGITVLVSHRFSTVRMADLIVVVDGGHVREVGTHDELMARHELYAELYTLQARAYT